MSAYLFSGLTVVSQWGENKSRVGPQEGWQTYFDLRNGIIHGGTPDEAESAFRDSYRQEPGTENKIEVQIVKISGAQFVDSLFTETGEKPLDWNAVNDQAIAKITEKETDSTEDFERGLWVDVNSVVRPYTLCETVDALRDALPDDVRAGVNWAPEKQYIFVLTVFSANDGTSVSEPAVVQAELAGEPVYGPDGQSLEELRQNFPEIRDKEVAAVVQARNSVVAAWLWLRYAHGTRVANNEIRINEWVGMYSLTE